MGDLVDELLKRHVTPVMQATGFKRNGAAYRRFTDNGDCAIVDFSRYRLVPGITSFFVHLSVAPLPFVEWLARKNPGWLARTRGREYALLVWEVEAPPEWQVRWHAVVPRKHLWGIADPADVDRCGAALMALLQDVAVPKLLSLLDRDTLRAEVLDPATTWPNLPRSLAAAMLAVDSLPAAEVRHLIDAAGPAANTELVAWLRQRLVTPPPVAN